MTSRPFSLFSAPSTKPVSSISPRVWPGVTPASTASLLKNLEDNHRRWHCFFNDRGFHNHSAHWLLASWSLGATPAVLDASYAHASAIQLERQASPEPITAANWTKHLGDEKYYLGYVEFFTEAVKEHGIAEAVEEYVFSDKVNVPNGDERPEMLARFLAGLLHPFIHSGYGFEFNSPVMAVEGLALTAVHGIASGHFLPDNFFQEDLGAKFEKLKTDGSAKGVHAFDVISRVLNDPSLDDFPNVGQIIQERYRYLINNHAGILSRHAQQWSIDLGIPGELERKIEELVWTATVIYGIGGWTEGKGYNADFILMHLVTSSLFLSSIAAQLKPRSQERLLRSYFTYILAWWVATGRPRPNIRKFFEATTDYLTPVGHLPTPNQAALPSKDSADAKTPNPWLPIIETTLVHPDDHLPKLQRSLAHYGTIYGSRVAGNTDFAETELEGAEWLDGSLFLRAAGLTAKRMGRIREGEKPIEFWDRVGFFDS